MPSPHQTTTFTGKAAGAHILATGLTGAVCAVYLLAFHRCQGVQRVGLIRPRPEHSGSCVGNSKRDACYHGWLRSWLCRCAVYIRMTGLAGSAAPLWTCEASCGQLGLCESLTSARPTYTASVKVLLVPRLILWYDIM